MPVIAIKLVLLPGMDGTGELFKGFVDALPDGVKAEVIQYPRDACLSGAELEALIEAALPTHEPFVLLAESFSTPLAIRCAAKYPANLEALILCAGFVTSPIQGWRRSVALLLAPILFRFPLPKFAARYFLVGKTAPHSLIRAVQAAVTSVKPRVLAERLRAVLGCNARAEMGRVAVPILLIQAEKDRLVSERTFAEIQRVQPRAIVAEVSGPHLILQREPGRCAEIITEFIEQFYFL